MEEFTILINMREKKNRKDFKPFYQEWIKIAYRSIGFKVPFFILGLIYLYIVYSYYKKNVINIEYILCTIMYFAVVIFTKYIFDFGYNVMYKKVKMWKLVFIQIGL